MGTPPTSEAELRDALAILAQHNGNLTHAAAAAGMSRGGFTDRVRKAEAMQHKFAKDDAVEFPALFDGDEPIEEVIDRMSRNFERAKKAQDARQWFPIKLKDNKPIGILFVGDPHVDDNGCNWPVLREHARISRETPGLYAVNIGDAANDWGGRLIKKYADQDTSVHTARRLVEWLLLDSGFSWIAWLHGNHQHMGNTSSLHQEMNKRHGTRSVPMLDWEARFVVQFPNGEEFRINAAHDFPGNSMWNPIHGPVKATKFGDRIDIAVCGHKHNWAVSQWENPEQGTSPLMIRARGYKHLDDYARRIGKYEQDEGQSILVVLDPGASTKAGRMTSFVDIERGAKYLSLIRG